MYYDEMLKTANVSTIHAFDSYDGKYMRSFSSYSEFRAFWPGAEIVGVDDLSEGTATGIFGVYC